MIPIYEAKLIDSDKYINGSYIEALQAIIPLKLDGEVIDGTINMHIRELSKMKVIDQTTLTVSFDGGKSFIKLSDLEVHTCTDFELKYSDMKMRDRKEIQPPNGSIFTIITDKGR